jgi:hypothetical protein
MNSLQYFAHRPPSNTTLLRDAWTPVGRIHAPQKAQPLPLVITQSKPVPRLILQDSYGLAA